MQTIRLKISDKVYDQFLSFLKEFKKEDIQIIEDAQDFLEHKKYLENELQEIENGNAIFLEEDEVYKRLDHVIRTHEDPL